MVEGATVVEFWKWEERRLEDCTLYLQAGTITINVTNNVQLKESRMIGCAFLTRRHSLGLLSNP